MIKTVLGDIKEDALGIILPHEHICCYSDYALCMAGRAYLDKELLAQTAVAYLREMKERYGLCTFVDCTPVNIGRDIELLKRVSAQSEVHIVCSTGFYYTEESILYCTPSETLCSYILSDVQAVNAGVIKCAVESETLSPYSEKVLRACAGAHLHTGLPIVMHTNAKNQNGRKALEILLSEGVKTNAVTVGHLSDTDDLEYVKSIASYGCFIGLDRLHQNTSEEYVSKKMESILELCSTGHEEQILLSHDALFFNGFDEMPTIRKRPRFDYLFECILPRFSPSERKRLTLDNPRRMLSCQ